jgi:hypothetical protein
VTQAVLVPSGTLVQTAGGVQFATLAVATIASGTAAIAVGAIATVAGTNGNVAASAISGAPLTSIGYPLSVYNGAPMAGGANAGSQSSALAQFTAKANSLGDCTPLAIANAAIGVTASGTGESVQYAACYDDVTEVLTEQGWFLFKELPRDVRVATLNPITHELEYQTPTAYHAYAYEGDLVTVRNKFLDIAMTPDHQAYVRSRGERKWRFRNADRLVKNNQFKRSYACTNPDIKSHKILHHKYPMDAWLEFLGYFVSEGCAGAYKGVRLKDDAKRTIEKGDVFTAYAVQIRQHEPVARAKIKAAVEALHYRVYEWNHQLQIRSKRLVQHLAPLGHGAANKHLPDYFRLLSSRQAKILLDALILGDGFDGRVNTKNHHSELTYFTSSKQLADEVQELALMAGMAASIKISDRIGRAVTIKGRGRTGTVRQLEYRVAIHKQGLETTIVNEPSRVPYKGTVYCVSVPNRIICVRRNGKTCWNGNCFEPWIYAGSGAGSGTAGFTLYVDDGTGSASAALLAAVAAVITGSQPANQPGYRPAGVPYLVSGVTPVYALVGVTGTLIPGLYASGNTYNAIVSGVQNYFASIGVSAPSGTTGASGTVLNIATQPQIAGAASDAGLGGWSSLAVNLYYSGSMTTVPVVSGGIGTRVILAGLGVQVS